MKQFTITEDFSGMRLDRFIKKACPEIGKNTAQKMIRKGDAKVNGKKASADCILNTGDTVKIYVREDAVKTLEINFELPDPEVIYEDELIMAVNKPPYLPSQPSSKGEDSVSERVKKYLADDIKAYDGLFSPGTANRLDTNTSGIVLAGKTPQAQRELSSLIASNKIDKVYTALVYGHFPGKMKVSDYAVKNTSSNLMTVYDEPVEGSVSMVSVFEPVEYIGEYTLLRAKLITGRTHQIRAQLSHLGYPVVLDRKYCDSTRNDRFRQSYGLNRQFLHCSEVSFKIWYDSSILKITCDLPEDLADVIGKLRSEK